MAEEPTETSVEEPADRRRVDVDLVVRADTVLTMSGDTVSGDEPAAASIAIDGGRIVAVGDHDDVAARHRARSVLDATDSIVIPGLVDAHRHLTGDRLLRSTIPDDLPLDRALREWALPSHAAHTGDDDELSATLSLVEAVTNGITHTVEAGTVGHPERVLAAFDAVGVGGALGTWGWDVGDGPWVAPVDEVLARQRAVAELTAGHPTVDGWVTLVGHDLMSDALVVAAAALADELGTRWSCHLSSTTADRRAYRRRTGRSPVQHLGDLDVLGDRLVIAHAVHVDDPEVDLLLDHDVAVVSCPWAYLRLGQGVGHRFRHAQLLRRGGRIALGCDSENAGDAIDLLLTARLFAGLAKDTAADPTALAASTALRLATIDGARAVGLGHEIGSIEPGKRADLVVIDATGPAWTPRPDDPTTALVWASDGRAVRHVVAGGRLVVRDGRCLTVDHRELAGRSRDVHRRLVEVCRAHSGHQ